MDYNACVALLLLDSSDMLVCQPALWYRYICVFWRQENYGRDVPECIKAIRQLYTSLGLEKQFRDYEDATYTSLRSVIEEQTALPGVIFTDFLQKLFKREK